MSDYPYVGRTQTGYGAGSGGTGYYYGNGGDGGTVAGFGANQIVTSDGGARYATQGSFPASPQRAAHVVQEARRVVGPLGQFDPAELKAGKYTIVFNIADKRSAKVEIEATGTSARFRVSELGIDWTPLTVSFKSPPGPNSSQNLPRQPSSSSPPVLVAKPLLSNIHGEVTNRNPFLSLNLSTGDLWAGNLKQIEYLALWDPKPA